MIGVHQYKLRKEFLVLKQDCYDVRIPKSYAPDEIVKTGIMKLNESTHINASNTVSDERYSDDSNITLFPQTNYPNANNIQPIRDESSHPVPTFNSTESLID